MSNLSLYKVRFEIFKYDGGEIKSVNTISDMLSGFITDFDSVESVEELIIELNNLINGLYDETGIPTKSLYLGLLNPSTVKLYDDEDNWYTDNSIIPNFELPTLDFLEIMEAWKNYISQ